jgi:hypothetical protein
MYLTTHENAVIDLVRESNVITMVMARSALSISHMTVFRALKKYGYFTSYNKNSSYYTLRDIPVFDHDGLWSYHDIYFSRWGTLEQTMIAIIEQSEVGMTVEEMRRKVGTEVRNLLARLCRRKQVNKARLGWYAVFLSPDPDRSSDQYHHRRQQEKKKKQESLPVGLTTDLPEGFDFQRVIRILVKLVEHPTTHLATLARSLQSEGMAITTHDLRTVLAFYSLEKKTEP